MRIDPLELRGTPELVRPCFSRPVGIASAVAFTKYESLAILEARQWSGERARERFMEKFAAGRAAARNALRDLGVPPGDVPVGPSMVPVWPPGIVGSITHITGFAMAVVGSENDYLGLGVDAEWEVRTIEERVAQRMFTEDELSIEAPRLALFCAKEAAFKAMHGVDPPPRTIAGVRLTPTLEHDLLEAELAGQAQNPETSVRWLTGEGLMLALAERLA